MGSWPFTRLHYGCNRCIAIAGPHIQVLDATSGTILWTQRCASSIACSAVDNTYTWLATTGEDKRLNVWALQGLELQSSRELPKKATVMQLSPDAQTILVSDKFGDVFSYPRIPSPDAPAPESKKRDAVASHATPHGSLILGHASIITALLLSHDGRYIFTADRDEHIRVSRFPQGHIIERYCLGHRLYLSALCLPAFEHSTLISGGGDPCLHFWDWMTGAPRYQIPVVESVRPFLRVRESKPRWHRANEGGRKGRGRGGKGREGSDKQQGSPGPSTQEKDADPTDTVESGKATSPADADFVFALAKIEAIDLNGDRNILFSVFGASALFYCSYPSHPIDMPPVRYIEFTQPVLDFVIGDHGHVLVSLDTAWTSSGSNDKKNLAITPLSWKDGAFSHCTEKSPLVDTLNGTASLDGTRQIASANACEAYFAPTEIASDAELAALELYSALSLLPKNAEGGEDGGGEHDTDSRPGTPGQRAKAAGRLQTKRNLSRRQEQGQGIGEEPGPKKIKLGGEV